MARAHCDLLFRSADLFSPAWSKNGDSGPRGAACSAGSSDAAAAQHGGPLHGYQLDQLAQPQERRQAVGRLPGEAITRRQTFSLYLSLIILSTHSPEDML
jgi:hypothetical protein